ncbi:glycosyltransferase [Loktanella sp. TSTF-M6]|uniref:Glycosyltransferase n=1 Tax=Loktanella gaetbuli TaxID=2881335 RepID=A0ABS8BY29_9RHOB|nr:glycosyltransferase [Loktanella gaetbuli]MCB5200640.1 glycosyltransferase [Loktanella gaetbuli]
MIAPFSVGSKPYRAFRNRLGCGAPDHDGDFRDQLMARAQMPHRIGFRQANLDTGFSANLARLFPQLIAVDAPQIDGDTPVLMYGALMPDPQKSHASTTALMPHVKPDDPVTYFEMGFLASTTSWAEALASRDPAQACLGYVFDDRAQYYMSDYETRLDAKLNGDFTLSPQDRDRAEAAMRRIVADRISKYNSQPFYRPVVSPEFARRVLVVDQNFSDASTFYGRADHRTFKAMLRAAIAENPDAEILVKTHPDLAWSRDGTRRGYFDHMTSQGRVRIIRDAVNPFELFDLVDTVYVGTSGMGLEALLAGKRVVCFGAPCYAGWGLTDDRGTVPHRHRSRDLAEFFHAFYIWYTVYHLPDGPVPARIEDVLDYIVTHRPVRPIPQIAPAQPTLSIVIPVHGVESYIAECLTSIQKQTFQDFEVIAIDDVSPDRSAAVVQAYADRDPRFRLVTRRENAGPGFVRNQGIDLARGRYVLFIDPDDYMPDPHHLDRIIAMAEADGVDMVRFRKVHEQIEDADGAVVRMRPDPTEAFFAAEVQDTTPADHPQIAHSRHFWNWLYRRDFLNDKAIRFKTAYREERAFLMQAYLANPRLSVCDSDGVVYRIRPGSAVRRKQTMSDVRDQLDNFDHVVSLLDDQHAFEPTSPHWWLARFQVSQFLHYLFFGFAWKTATEEGETDAFMTRLATTLQRTALWPDDVIGDPDSMAARHFRCGAYGLLLAATMAQRADLIALARTLRPVPADTLYDIYLHAPQTPTEHRLQAALNTYARNERVTQAGARAAAPARPIRLIIHIGATKTGSTALQHLMDDNRPALLRAGIWYPETGLLRQIDRPSKQAGHARFMAEARRGGTALRRHILSGLAAMGDRIHTVILSSEAFFLEPDSTALARHFPDFDVEMIVYLRRQDEWANAQYAEFVAGGAISREALPFADWLSKPATQTLLDYDGLLRRWKACLPQSALHVRRYDRSDGRDWDIITDFTDTLNLPVIGDLPRPAADRGNAASLSACHVELIRHYNLREYDTTNAYLGFVGALTDRLLDWRRARDLPMTKPWFLTDTLSDRIMAQAAKGNARIAQEHFDRSGGDAFPPRAAPPPDSTLYLAECNIAEATYQELAIRRTTRPGMVNYGPLAWRRWTFVPLMTAGYAMRGKRILARRFWTDPAGFALTHWAGRRPGLMKMTFAHLRTDYAPHTPHTGAIHAR